MDRRRFLRSSSAAAAAGLVLPRLSRGANRHPGGAPALERIGVQLYTLRSLMAESVERTLETVARIGYREVELAGLFDHTPREFREILDRVGLTAPATHLGIDVFRSGLDRAIADAAVLGHNYLILPSLPRDTFASLDALRAIADEFNAFGERCADAGLRFGFHNHDAELRRTSGEVPLRIFLERTDPGLVTFEVDLFWMVHGGGDPLGYFDDHPGRFELCHVKDRTEDGEMVDVGSGVIDFAAIFAEAERAGLRHYFVEHDRPGDAAESIAASYAHLAALRPGR